MVPFRTYFTLDPVDTFNGNFVNVHSGAEQSSSGLSASSLPSVIAFALSISCMVRALVLHKGVSAFLHFIP